MPTFYTYGGVTLFAASFQTTLIWTLRQLSVARTPHPPTLFVLGFSLAFSPFARCYSGNHDLFSTPAHTKMLQF
jgi:hypothetical protein